MTTGASFSSTSSTSVTCPKTEASGMVKYLPDDITLKIFAFLERFDLFKAMLVCKQWRELAAGCLTGKITELKIESDDFINEDIALREEDAHDVTLYTEWIGSGEKESDENPPYVADFLANQTTSYFDHHREEKTRFAIHSPNGRLSALGECGCPRTNRLQFPKERTFFENATAAQFAHIFLSKGEIELTFVASGFLYGEFAVVMKFLDKVQHAASKPKEGFISINIVDILYESLLEKEKILAAVETFEREIRMNLPSSYQLILRAFDHTDNYLEFVRDNEENRPDCLVSIEASEADDLLGILTPNVLKKYGFFSTICRTQRANGELAQLVELEVRRVLENQNGDCLFFRKQDRVYYQNNEIKEIEAFIDINYSNQQVIKDLVPLVMNFIYKGEAREEAILKDCFRACFIAGPFHEYQFKFND